MCRPAKAPVCPSFINRSDEMNSEQQENFLRYAEQLGHDRQTLATQGRQVSSVTVGSIDELRALVRPIHPPQAVPPMVVETGPRRGAPTLEERVQAYLYGDGDLTAAERKLCQPSFPVTVTLVSEGDRTLPSGETPVGPNAPPTVWNYGTLNFRSDSYVTVKSTYFTLNVQNLVMQYTGP